MDPEHPDKDRLRRDGVDPYQTHEQCGFTRNVYRWLRCPNCLSDNRRQYALQCLDCWKPYYATERQDLCPRCDSGNTQVVSEPESPRVR